MKHGGQTVILPDHQMTAFRKLHHDLRLSFQPANALEESLVSTLADTQFAIDRMRSNELAILALGHERLAGAIETEGHQIIQSTFAGAKAAKDEIAALKDISLYLQRNTRMYEMTLKQIHAVQALRKAEEKETVHIAAQLAVVHRKLNIPFDQTEYGLVCTAAQIEQYLRRQKPGPAPNRQTNAA